MLDGTLDLTAFTKLDHLGCTNNMLENLILPPSVSTLICSTNNLSELDITSCPELMKSGDEDSFCVGKQRKNKVLTLHLTSQQNRYWLRTYSETDENTNSNILLEDDKNLFHIAFGEPGGKKHVIDLVYAT